MCLFDLLEQRDSQRIVTGPLFPGGSETSVAQHTKVDLGKSCRSLCSMRNGRRAVFTFKFAPEEVILGICESGCAKEVELE
ncbi:hypothetical protein GLUCOINTEAF2_0203765 [Komagataeibacter intermedius AF2]|uniref:Uncharacterized protein n=1 Tax=Komagataeibacter intermedius AF2 TaxID=1458464 RepID=A0A0N0MH25_9PROT|nr:hypothetical protein GLUCOINTEAF2_0203765 [Komagataeibacter intermedius AF2]